MSEKKQQTLPANRQHVRLTVQLSLAAYDAVNRLQQEYRVKRGRAVPKWRILDAADKQYAESKGIQRTT